MAAPERKISWVRSDVSGKFNTLILAQGPDSFYEFRAGKIFHYP